MYFYEKVHSWSRAVSVKAWSKTIGILALSSGESELASGQQQKVRDRNEFRATFGFFGHVAIKSGATAAIGIVHRLGFGKVRHLAVGVLWVQHHVRSGIIRVSKM